MSHLCYGCGDQKAVGRSQGSPHSCLHAAQHTSRTVILSARESSYWAQTMPAPGWR